MKTSLLTCLLLSLSLTVCAQQKWPEKSYLAFGAGMAKPFGEAVSKLQKDGYTHTPVQTQFGWHVIKLEGTRPMQPPAYDKVKAGLQKQLQQQQLKKLLTDLHAKAKIVGNMSAK